MDFNKSLDNVVIYTNLLTDIEQMLGQEVYTPRERRLDIQKISKRFSAEGVAFFTKTLPRLGKALDRALTGVPLAIPGFKLIPGTKIPKLFGCLFKRVISRDGRVLQTPCTDSIRLLRQLTHLFYKYEIPYSPQLEQKVLDQFEKTETDLSSYVDCKLCNLRVTNKRFDELIIKARKMLEGVFADFDGRNIVPRHGPGVVSTKESLFRKYTFGRYSPRIAKFYPIDEYFFVNGRHLCDELHSFNAMVVSESCAKVILVPKDSRGPRLISCEPLENQWIQQGLGRAMMFHIENHPSMRLNVNFTDQGPNRNAALKGSITGNTCTLDLAEASDRVSAGLVRQLFPRHLFDALDAARSEATILPDGRILKLKKYAPMGSALCFPVLASTVWAILMAGCNADFRKEVLVYGDDVIVPKTEVLDAIASLELVGLLVNRDKSCTSGFFRESCGMDAYKGVDVTPVRFRTVWSSTPSASAYTSWIAYANQMYERGYRSTAMYIAGQLIREYKSIPMDSDWRSIAFPALCFYHPDNTEPKTRTNRFLQKREQLVLVSEPKRLRKDMNGWSMLLRYFTEGSRASDTPVYNPRATQQKPESHNVLQCEAPFSARVYTHRRRNKLRRRWR